VVPTQWERPILLRGAGGITITLSAGRLAHDPFM
jgi:hypothetical protein